MKEKNIKEKKEYKEPSVFSRILNVLLVSFVFNIVFVFTEFFFLTPFVSDNDFYLIIGTQYFLLFIYMCHSEFWA